MREGGKPCERVVCVGVSWVVVFRLDGVRWEGGWGWGNGLTINLTPFLTPCHPLHTTTALTNERAIAAAVTALGYRCRHLKTDVAASSSAGGKGKWGFHGQVGRCVCEGEREPVRICGYTLPPTHLPPPTLTQRKPAIHPGGGRHVVRRLLRQDRARRGRHAGRGAMRRLPLHTGGVCK